MLAPASADLILGVQTSLLVAHVMIADCCVAAYTARADCCVYNRSSLLYSTADVDLKEQFRDLFVP